MKLPSKEEILNNEDVRLQIVQEDLEDWRKLGEKMHVEYANLITGLHKQRRETIKFLGTIAGGAAALAPQLLDKIQQLNYFYIGTGLLCMVVIISITYVLSTIENETSILARDLRSKNEMLDRIKKPKYEFLSNGNFGIDDFVGAMSGAVDEIPKLTREIEAGRAVDKGWYKPMDYTGEFIIWFFVSGIALLVLSLTHIHVLWNFLFWASVIVFVVINLISTFPTSIFKILGLPIDLFKALVRFVFKKS